MRPGLGGTSCLAPGFDMKQMMTPSATAFTLPSQTRAQEHGGDRRLGASCEDPGQAGSDSTAQQAPVPGDGRVSRMRSNHARARVRAPVVFT